MSDKKHSAALLGDSEILRVKHPPRKGVTWTVSDAGRLPSTAGGVGSKSSELADDGREIVGVSRAEKVGDVLKNEPPGTRLVKKARQFEKKAGSLAAETGSTTGNRDVLARESAGEDVDRGESSGFSDVSVESQVRMPEASRVNSSC